MLRRSMTKCSDQKVYTIFYYLYPKSYICRNKSSGSKPHSPLLTFQNNFTNLLNNFLDKRIQRDPYAEIKQYLKEHNLGTTVAVNVLKDIFSIDNNEARTIIEKSVLFKHLTKQEILANYDILKNSGFNRSQIYNNVSLLSEKYDILQNKIENVQKIVNICEGMPLLHHDNHNIALFIKKNTADIHNNSIKNRMKYFKQTLQLEYEELIKIISKYLYYMTYHPEQTVQKLKMLLDYGISVNSLVQDNWPMHNSYEKMQWRLDEISKIELIKPIKPWVLIDNEDVFKRKKDTTILNKTILNEQSSIIQFLSINSGYSEILIKFRIHNMKIINQLRDVAKLKKNIEIILKEGYNYDDIIWNLNVLILPNDFIENRFSKLKTINYKAPFLDILFLSNKSFVDYVNSKKNGNM